MDGEGWSNQVNFHDVSEPVSIATDSKAHANDSGKYDYSNIILNSHMKLGNLMKKKPNHTEHQGWYA